MNALGFNFRISSQSVLEQGSLESYSLLHPQLHCQTVALTDMDM